MTDIREFEAHVGDYLREVQVGETVRITHEGRIVAELRPPTEAAGQPESQEAWYRDLMARGIIRPALTPEECSWAEWPGLGLPPGSTQALLDAERGT